MKFGVLSAPDSWYLRDLQRAASGRCEIIQAGFDQLTAQTEPNGPWRIGSNGISMSDLDAVLVRTMPPGSLEQVVFRMDCLARLASQGTPVVNPPKALETAVDKYLTTAQLTAAGFTMPDTAVCQKAADALACFESLGRDVVVKPLFGGEGRGLMRVEDEALAGRVFRTLEGLGAVLYLQRYIPHHGYDVRLFVLGDQVLGMRRRNPHDWRTNVSRGASTEPFAVTPEWHDLATSAAAVIGAPIAGVDVLPALDGTVYVLEVNAVPGWKALARTLDVDVAARILDYLAGSAGGRSTCFELSTKM